MRYHGGIKVLLSILILMAIFLTGIERVTFNREFYEKSFEKYNVPQDTGFAMDELLLMVQDIKKYVSDKKDSLEPQWFSEKDILHMVDVKELFIKAFRVRNISLLLMLFLLGFLFVCEGARGILRTLKWSALVPLLGIILGGIIITLDFSRYFTYFHLIFFDNDLWLLDPVKDMVRFFPEPLFMDAAIYAVTFTVLWLSAILLGSIIGLKLIDRRILTR